MRGQTCGLCGQADGEIRQEYRTPNKHIAKNAVNFAHSWVIPATTCQNADSNIYLHVLFIFLLYWEFNKTNEPVFYCLCDHRQLTLGFPRSMWVCTLTRLTFPAHLLPECYMKAESVKLDRQISLNSQDSKCYSVEPVLRCLPECTPVRTTTVNVGFHCVPTSESQND